MRGRRANCRQRKIQSSSPCQIRRINRRQAGADRKCSSRGTSKPGRQHKRRELRSLPLLKGDSPSVNGDPLRGVLIWEGVRLTLFLLPPPTLSLFVCIHTLIRHVCALVVCPDLSILFIFIFRVQYNAASDRLSDS